MLSKGKKIYVTIVKGGRRRVAALDYLKNLKGEGNRVEDYLTSPSPGIWFNPTGLFGLRGGIKDGEFTNLFSGRHPHTGVALGRKVDLDRLGGVEFACSPPKDFSILWSAGNTEQRHVLQSAHDASVLRMLVFLVEHAARSRKGAGGRGGLVRANVIAGLFNHKTSREADPQVHTHVAFVNLAMLGNGKLRALEFREFLKWRGAASAIYRIALAMGLRELGVRVERKGRNFILPDVPRGLAAEQSQRRRFMRVFHLNLIEFLRAGDQGLPAPVSARIEKAIRKFLAEWMASGKPRLDWREVNLDDEEGDSGYADAVALATRGKKSAMTRDELEAEWAAKRAKYGFTIDQVLGRAPPPQPSTLEERAEIVRSAAEQLVAVDAVLEEREVIRVVAEHGQGELGYEDVRRAVFEAKLKRDLLVLRDSSGDRLFTTFEALKRERRIIEAVKRRSREDHHEIAVEHFHSVVTNTMTECQKEALVCSALGRGVGVIEEGDGRGKVTIMDAVCAMHELAGYEVLACTFSKRAAAQFAKSSAMAFRTIDRLLAELGDSLRQIGMKTCIVVAEARRISSAPGEALLKAAERCGSKILLVGNSQQVMPIAVAAGSAQDHGHTSPEIIQAMARQGLDQTAAAPHWRQRNKRMHVFDYLGEQRVQELLDERRPTREGEDAAPKQHQAVGGQAAGSLADLVPPLPPMQIDPELREKLRQLRRHAVASESAGSVRNSVSEFPEIHELIR